MNIKKSATYADKAIRSTGPIYQIIKATDLHGERMVINAMAELYQHKTNASYAESVISAAIRHQEVMSLHLNNGEYKELCRTLDEKKSTLSQGDILAV